MKCWSSTWLAGRTTFDLAQGAHRWVDVVFADDGGQGVKALRFGFPPRQTPLRLGLLGFGNRGSYSFRVIATAENASAVKKRRGEIPEFASQRLRRASLTRGNVGGSHTRGKSIAETALAG
jgi:hypothetical protein